MKKKQKTDKGNLGELHKSRPTIGYLAPSLQDICQPVWLGIVDAARKRDVNLVCFQGANLRNPFWMQSNIIYDLATAENLDGVISWASMIGAHVTVDELEAFHERYYPLPLVTMGRTLEKGAGVLMDSYEGMREAIVHLIEVHGHRRLAFIRGPDNHVYAQGRYQAYEETLEAYGLPLDLNLITPSAPWGYATGREMMRLLLDERKLRPHIDFEAVVAVSEDALVGALEILQARGLNIPGDVALVGFDDSFRSQTSTPPLTTVAPPYYETGYHAVETLLAMMEGSEVPQQVILPSKLVVRRSCGCKSTAMEQVTAGLRPAAKLKLIARPGSAIDPAKASRRGLEAVLIARREEILAGMTQAVGELGGSLNPRWAGQLLDGFAAELGGQSTGAFLAALDEVLRQVVITDGNVPAWHGTLSALRVHFLPYLDGKTLLQAENLWQQARVVIEEAEQRVQAYQQLQAEERVQILREIGTTLITTFNVGELMDVLAEELPRLDIFGTYLALYEDPQLYKYPQPAPEWSQLILACDGGRAKDLNCVELEPEKQRFSSRRLLPEHIWPQERHFTMVVVPLHFQEHQLGFVLFEVGPREGRIYHTLNGEISSALYGAFLLQERRRAEVELGQAYTEVERQVEERTHKLQQEIVERRRTEEELKRYRTHLEELVRERTRDLEQAQAELVRQERLSALGELTATVAHEIRNPLGTVRTSVFAIEDAIKRNEMGRVERALQLAERNIIRCDNIISELLDYTHDRVLQLKPVNIDVWLDQVLDEQTIPENIVCVRALQANVKTSIDSEHLRRAIINVISNAVDAMQEKGAGRSVGNPSELVEGQNRLTVGTHIVGDRLEIQISNTGGGISDEVMNRLFEPLFSTKNFGVGLGLPIVKNIMEQHGGGVEIQSKLGQGTDVTLWLPIFNNGND